MTSEHNTQNDSINKKTRLSATLLCVSLIIFSVVIPNIQHRINDIAETRRVYEMNVINAQAEINKAQFNLGVYNALTMLKEENATSGENLNKAIERIRSWYYQNITEAFAKNIFLITEPPDEGKPEQKRLNNLYKKSLKELEKEEKESALYMEKYAGKLYERTKRLSLIRLLLYILASITNVLGIWFGVISKDPQIGILTKEISLLNNKVNTFLKKNR